MWSSLAEGAMLNHFFQSALHQWMVLNLEETSEKGSTRWNILFRVALSFLWKIWDERVFREKHYDGRNLISIRHHAETVQASLYTRETVPSNVRWDMIPGGPYPRETRGN